MVKRILIPAALLMVLLAATLWLAFFDQRAQPNRPSPRPYDTPAPESAAPPPRPLARARAAPTHRSSKPDARTESAPPTPAQNARGRIGGLVVDAQKRPLAGAGVEALPVDRSATAAAFEAAGARAFETTTSAQGRFELPALSPGRYLVRARTRGLLPSAPRAVEVLARGRVEIELVCERGVSVSGRVTDHRGNGLARVALSALSEPGGKPLAYTHTGGDGRFRLVLPQSAQIALLVHPPEGLGEQRFGPVRAPAEGIEIALEEPAQVVGRVRSALDGRPLSGARVDIRTRVGERELSFGVETDREGRFALGPLAPAPYRVLITKPGYLPRTLELGPLTAGERRLLECSLEQGLCVDFELLAGTSLQPVADAEIRLLALEPEEGGVWPSARTTDYVCRTDARGRARLCGLIAGRLTVEAHAAGHPSAVFRERIGPSASLPLRLVLPRAGAIAGLITDQSERPLAGALIRASLLDGSATLEARTDAAGRFELRALSPGTWAIAIFEPTAIDESAPAAMRMVHLQEGERRSIHVRVGR